MIDINKIRKDAERAEATLTAHLGAIRAGRIANDQTETARLRADLLCRKSDLNFWEGIQARAEERRRSNPPARCQIALFGQFVPLPEERGAFALPSLDEIRAKRAAS